MSQFARTGTKVIAILLTNVLSRHHWQLQPSRSSKEPGSGSAESFEFGHNNKCPRGHGIDSVAGRGNRDPHWRSKRKESEQRDASRWNFTAWRLWEAAGTHADSADNWAPPQTSCWTHGGRSPFTIQSAEVVFEGQVRVFAALWIAFPHAEKCGIAIVWYDFHV